MGIRATMCYEYEKVCGAQEVCDLLDDFMIMAALKRYLERIIDS